MNPNQTITAPGIAPPDVIEMTCLASPTIPGQMRMSVTMKLIEWGFGGPEFEDFRDDVLAVASEFLNNAIEHTPEDIISFRCYPDTRSGEVTVAAWDSGPGDPFAQMPDITIENLDLTPENFDANSGWGCPLAIARSDRQGIDRTPNGKWVWARIRARRRRAGEGT